MIEESILKSNFIGRDGFRWWIGQVAPFESGTGQENQNNGGGWGNRAKVRILGYHSFDEAELSNEDLPWAQVLLPTTSGSGAGNVATNTKLRPSDSVFGFFLDGDNAQIPVILGVFGRTSDVSKQPFNPVGTKPFTPFSGYTSRIEKPNGTLPPNESNEQNSQSQKSPRDVPAEALDSSNQQINIINKRGISGTGAGTSTSAPLDLEVPYYTAIGRKIILANTTEDTSFKSIVSDVNSVFDKVNGFKSSFTNIDLEIDRATASIKSSMNGVVSQMYRSLVGTLIPTMQEGLSGIYNTTATSFVSGIDGAPSPEGILAGVEAQKAFIEPVFGVQDTLICSIGEIITGLDEVIPELLRDVIDNVDNFVSCAGTQFAGSLLTSVISKISELVQPSLEGVSGILGEGVDVFAAITSSVDTISKVGVNTGSGLCENPDITSRFGGLVTEYIIGQGPKSTEDSNEFLTSVLENVKLSAGLVSDVSGAVEGLNQGYTIYTQFGEVITQSGQVLDAFGSGSEFVSGIGECDTSLPRPLDVPEIKIFGGGGTGATGEVVLGGFVRNVPDIGQSVNDAQITASIIGVNITNPGEGYKYPPFIEIVDKSKQGYGAVVRSRIIDGKVSEAYVVSTGENYPIGNIRVVPSRVPIVGPGGVVIDPTNLRYNPTAPQYRIPRQITVGVGSAVNVGIASLSIIKPGTGYDTGDIIVDPFDAPILTGFGDPIGIKTGPNGEIVGFESNSPIAIIAEDYPRIRVRSLNGIGAEIRPSIGIVTAISKLTQIIDCIS